ncbi:MAG: FAD/NAD(P)-binding protein [Proteobacteria bacterium]|nr:FAD/NAD(P)-binding protein [Pseudomonadota bacterium]
MTTGPRVAIIGGGYTGCAAAIHLRRTSPVPLDISIVEPAPELGRGVAYGTPDPDHRINGPTTAHFIYPDDLEHFDRWHRNSGALAADPESVDGLGRVFPRRADMGRYVGGELQAHQIKNPSGSSIRHVNTRAETVIDRDGVFAVTLDGRDELTVDQLIITTSNAPPAVLPALRNVAESHSAFYPDPWDIERLGTIGKDAKILIVGTGLTMADAAVMLLRDRPGATVTAISRRGLLPTIQRTVPPEETLPEAMAREVPEFVRRHGTPKRARDILRALRRDADDMMAEGGEWQVAFDWIRDAAYQLWPALSADEQSRFVRHLWPWYETHRFRFPPQIETKIQIAIEGGRLSVDAAALLNAEPRGDKIEVTFRRRGNVAVQAETFHAVINCTGPERKPRQTGDPFLQNLVSGGYLVNHPLGLGLVVDDLCRAQNSKGDYDGRIRVVGPLTRGQFGEINGIPHTAFHTLRIMPNILAEMETVDAEGA